MAQVVFLDTEFTSLAVPRLLSLGLVSGDGREFYLEWDLDCPQAQPLRGCANNFVLTTVLPQFGHLADKRAQAASDFGLDAAQWLANFADASVEVAYDYHADYDLLEAALQDSPLWPALQRRLVPTHVGYLLGDADAQAAMQASWQASSTHRGLERHHALADAWALRAAYQAVHGLPA